MNPNGGRKTHFLAMRRMAAEPHREGGRPAAQHDELAEKVRGPAPARRRNTPGRVEKEESKTMRSDNVTKGPSGHPTGAFSTPWATRRRTWRSP
ncbi:MAG: hypothetical protein ACLTYN_07265 [Dysosmobacter welbionis]